MPQPMAKSTDAVKAVKSSKRQTFNSTKGDVLMICDEETLSPAQKLIYSKYDDHMTAYTKAVEAYNKTYSNSEAANASANLTVSASQCVIKGNGIVQNGVTIPQPQPKPQPQIMIPVAPVKKAIVPTAAWQPQAQLINKATIPGNFSITSNLVTAQQVIPRLMNPLNATPRTVIQVPAGTDLTGMQVVTVPGSSANYQLVVPQATYPGINSTILPRSNAPASNPRPVPISVQNFFIPASTGVTISPAPSGNKIVTSSITASVRSAVSTIQAVSIAKVSHLSEQPTVNSQAGSAKRALPADSDSSSKKRQKLDEAPNQPDVEENYYGWKQGRLWWDDEKPKGSFRCYLCNKKLPTNIRYMQHVKHHLDKEQQQNSTLNNLISCRSCYKHFNSASALQRHIEKSHKYCEHRCGICETTFNDGSSLLVHLSKNHQSLQMPYVCGVCNYASSIYDDLVLHFNKHHEGSKALMCPFCVRIIRCNNAFLRHCKTHLTVSIKNGLFRCRCCKLMFLNNSMLKEHLQEDHKSHQLQHRNGIPQLPMYKTTGGKPAQAVPVDKVSFPKQSQIKVSAALWTRREIIKPRGHLRCVECGMMIDVSADHFRIKMSCNRCKYTTHCGTAFANHMIIFHKAGSAPKIHRIRKTVVNNGRILLGCRNCEFSTLSPTLMACHIESCPRGALTIESFKVRTSSLQSSRNFKREVMAVRVNSTKRDEGEDDDDDDDEVIVIEDEVLVDLTDDTPNTSEKAKVDSSNSKSDESTKNVSLAKNVGSLKVKLEKLPDDIQVVLAISLSTKQDDKVKEVEDTSTGKEKEKELDNQEQATDNNEPKQTTDNNLSTSGDERMEVDEYKDESSDSTGKKTPDEDKTDKNTKELAESLNEESKLPANDNDRPSEDPANDNDKPAEDRANDNDKPAEDPANDNDGPSEDPANDNDKPPEDPANDNDKPSEDPANENDKPSEDPANDNDKTAEDPANDNDKLPEDPANDNDRPAEDPANDNDKPSEDPANDNDKPAEDPANDNDKPAEDTANENDKPAENPANDHDKPLEDTANDNDKPAEDPANDNDKPSEDPANDNDKPSEDQANDNDKTAEDPANDNDEPSEDKTEPSEDSDNVIQMKEVRIKLEQINTEK